MSISSQLDIFQVCLLQFLRACVSTFICLYGVMGQELRSMYLNQNIFIL